MKSWLYILNWATAIFGTALIMGFVYRSANTHVLQAIDVRMTQAGGHEFITVGDIEDMVHNMSYQEGNTMLKEINVQRIEQSLADGPYVKSAEVYTTIDGNLCLKIKQREPLFRVFTASGLSHFIDKEGRAMPTSSTYHPKVPVVSGAVNLNYAESIALDFSQESDTTDGFDAMHEVFEVIKWVEGSTDPFWSQMIVQYHIEDNGDIVLVPRVGNHKVVLGSADRLEQKMADLRLLYKEGFAKTGWNQYEEVNIKFENQIICKRKEQ